MDERARRIGLNEAVFREVNERIEDLAQQFGIRKQPLDLVCECGDASCVNQITMTIGDFEKMRSESALFAVHPGHVAPDVEDVVDKRDGYDIVRKHEGGPARLAEQTDRRT
jgi:hypothetical protein